MTKWRLWQLPLAFLCFALLLSQCRDQKNVEEVSQQVEFEKKVEVKKVPKVIKDLTAYADLVVSDTMDLTDLVSFKEIDSSGNIHNVDMDKAASRFKQMMTNKTAVSIPIIEITNTDEVIFMVQGRGYGGPIWAKLLLDKKEMLIKKLELQHSAESEGYGASITMSSFENQFLDKKIGMEGNAFGLEQGGTTFLQGAYKVDGISGATQTSMAVVGMINQGLGHSLNHIVQ